MLVSSGGRKRREPGEKPSEQSENQHQTRPPYNTGRNPTRAALVGGERAHLCAIRAPRRTDNIMNMS